MRDVAEEMLRAHGREFTIRRQDGTEEVYLGHKEPSDQYVMFLPEVGVKAGDLIVDPPNPDEYFVTNVEPLIDEGRAVAAQAFYKTREQREAAEAASRPSSTTNNLHIGQAPGANINTGTQGDIDMSGASYDFRSIEEKIDRFAANPAEAEEFRAVLEEIQRQMREDGAIKGGSLVTVNDKMQKASWFTSPLTALLMRFFMGV